MFYVPAPSRLQPCCTRLIGSIRRGGALWPSANTRADYEMYEFVRRNYEILNAYFVNVSSEIRNVSALYCLEEIYNCDIMMSVCIHKIAWSLCIFHWWFMRVTAFLRGRVRRKGAPVETCFSQSDVDDRAY